MPAAARSHTPLPSACPRRRCHRGAYIQGQRQGSRRNRRQRRYHHRMRRTRRRVVTAWTMSRVSPAGARGAAPPRPAPSARNPAPLAPAPTDAHVQIETAHRKARSTARAGPPFPLPVTVRRLDTPAGSGEWQGCRGGGASVRFHSGSVLAPPLSVSGLHRHLPRRSACASRMSGGATAARSRAAPLRTRRELHGLRLRARCPGASWLGNRHVPVQVHIRVDLAWPRRGHAPLWTRTPRRQGEPSPQ